MHIPGYLKSTLAVVAGSILLTSFTMENASAFTVQKTFTLNATSPYKGTGLFSYDDAFLFSTGDPSGNFYSDILNVTFGYTGQLSQAIADPFKRVNFDSSSNFLGIDLEIPDPLNPSDTILIANENAYIPTSTTTVSSGVVTYGSATAVPTPALLPSLVGMGLASFRRKRTRNI